jgi:hypothetical protein
MPIDDVAVDFPDMPIIMAHPFRRLPGDFHLPARVVHDLDGAQYFSPTLIQRQHPAETQGAFRIGLPLIAPDRWLADFGKIAIKDKRH